MFEVEIKLVNFGDYKFPNIVYVVVKYIEEFMDFIVYKENFEFKGYCCIVECC